MRNGDDAPVMQDGSAEPRSRIGWPGLPLRAREILALGLLTLCVVVLTTAVHLYHVQQILWTATLREAELAARQIYAQSARALSRRTSQDPRTVLSRDPDLRALLDATVGYAPWLLYAVITDDKGVAIVHSDRKREGQLVPPQRSLRELVSDHPLQRMLGAGRTSQIYEVGLPFNINDRPLATIRLGIAMPLLQGRLDDAFWYTVALGAAALAAALVVALALSSVTLKPIRSLAEDMARLRSSSGSRCDGAILVVRDLKSVAVSARTFQSLIQYSAQLAALGQITSEVAHDVKNPLHAMVVHVAFLKERLANPPPDVVRSLGVLEGEINRAAAVVDRFMEIVYPAELARQSIDLNALLQEVAALLQGEWQAKGVILAVHVEGELPQLTGDEQMLRRAFMNLILNACQAMPGGGRVTITTEAEAESMLKVTVGDAGVGIPPENVERIFKMYYTTKPEGTGIGLALVRRVVDLHRGSIEILSTVGQGTNVIVRLPGKPAV